MNLGTALGTGPGVIQMDNFAPQFPGGMGSTIGAGGGGLGGGGNQGPGGGGRGRGEGGMRGRGNQHNQGT